MEQTFANDLSLKVNELLDQPVERQRLFQALKQYQQTYDVDTLVGELKEIIKDPNKIQLYNDIRPLILLRQQMEYDKLLPQQHMEHLRIINLEKSHQQQLGFAVVGGLEHGIGVYVSKVVPNSQADIQGLRVGDQILRLNGFTIDQAIHEEILAYIKTSRELILKVRNVGMVPIKSVQDDKLKWQYITQENKAVSNGHQDTVKLFISIPPGAGLGCSICSGSQKNSGIYLQSTKVGGLAEEAGLEVGDQILNVNGTRFDGISHSEAIVALKSSRQLYIQIKKGAGLEFLSSGSDDTIEALPQNTSTASQIRYEPTRDINDNSQASSYKAPSQLSNGQANVEVHNDAPAPESLQKLFKNSARLVEAPDTNKELTTKVDETNSSDPYSLFTEIEIDGRDLVQVVVPIEGGTVDMTLEGGLDSPLGKVVVGEVFQDGNVYKQGGVKKGDTVMMVGDFKLVNTTLKSAQNLLDKALQSSQGSLGIIVAISPPKHYEDEVTYF
ncbi:unnamed protein product [Owenia fusiformis]|uniref:PDZ domain-containing protein n=1 Tax=Owenia fusiformis TaxID=6347 RepID=A0A8S4NV47_OWEFU|nr:unnamed protein product [Owenia fusiformis]